MIYVGFTLVMLVMQSRLVMIRSGKAICRFALSHIGGGG
jgi:hypothetical protein